MTFKRAIAGDSTSQYFLAQDLDSDYCFRLTLDDTTFRCSVQTALYRINSKTTFHSLLKHLFLLNPSNATYLTIFNNAIENNDTDVFELCISAVHNPQNYIVARQAFLALLDIGSKHFNLNWFDLASLQRVLDEDGATIKNHSTSDDIALSSKRFSSSVVSLFHRHAKFFEEIGHISGKAAIDWSIQNKDKLHFADDLTPIAMDIVQSQSNDNRLDDLDKTLQYFLPNLTPIQTELFWSDFSDQLNTYVKRLININAPMDSFLLSGELWGKLSTALKITSHYPPIKTDIIFQFAEYFLTHAAYRAQRALPNSGLIKFNTTTLLPLVSLYLSPDILNQTLSTSPVVLKYINQLTPTDLALFEKTMLHITSEFPLLQSNKPITAL